MNNTLVKKALLWGIIWAFSYYFVRRALNPANEGKLETFKDDAIYGGLAVAVTVILQNFAQRYV
jgi:hypothetical protein